MNGGITHYEAGEQILLCMRYSVEDHHLDDSGGERSVWGLVGRQRENRHTLRRLVVWEDSL